MAFIIAEVIPFFSSRKQLPPLDSLISPWHVINCDTAVLSLMSSLFDSFFGFIFWGIAYFRMRKADGSLALLKEHSVVGYTMAAINAIVIIIGFFFLTVGTYASVQSIIDEFESGLVGSVFTCATNGL